MTTFGCPECGRVWQEGPTRDHTENYLCRKCTEALAREAGELLARYFKETPLGHQPHMIAHKADETITRLRAAGILEETKPWPSKAEP